MRAREMRVKLIHVAATWSGMIKPVEADAAFGGAPSCSPLFKEAVVVGSSDGGDASSKGT